MGTCCRNINRIILWSVVLILSHCFIYRTTRFKTNMQYTNCILHRFHKPAIFLTTLYTRLRLVHEHILRYIQSWAQNILEIRTNSTHILNILLMKWLWVLWLIKILDNTKQKILVSWKWAKVIFCCMHSFIVSI